MEVDQVLALLEVHDFSDSPIARKVELVISSLTIQFAFSKEAVKLVIPGAAVEQVVSALAAQAVIPAKSFQLHIDRSAISLLRHAGTHQIVAVRSHHAIDTNQLDAAQIKAISTEESILDEIRVRDFLDPRERLDVHLIRCVGRIWVNDELVIPGATIVNGTLVG